VPAFSDSEMGLDTALNNRLRESTGRHKIRYDPFEDLEPLRGDFIAAEKTWDSDHRGGVPRNWSQQFGPFCELRHRRLGENVALKALSLWRCGLSGAGFFGEVWSGSPYSEAVSWGKFVPPSEGGRFGEVFCRCDGWIAP